MNRRSATNGADYYLPGYFVADAFAAYRMKLQYPVTLQLNVKNLFDKSYETATGYPASERTYFVNASYQL